MGLRPIMLGPYRKAHQNSHSARSKAQPTFSIATPHVQFKSILIGFYTCIMDEWYAPNMISFMHHPMPCIDVHHAETSNYRLCLTRRALALDLIWFDWFYSGDHCVWSIQVNFSKGEFDKESIEILSPAIAGWLTARQLERWWSLSSYPKKP